MLKLSELKNTSRPKKKIQRVGRGVGSRRGKTSCRGAKGDGSRSGYKRRYGYEGGQVPLYRKLPVRGFTRGRFAQPSQAVTLAKIDAYYADGEVVSPITLREKGLITRKVVGEVKILSTGELNKKVSIEAHGFSAATLQKLEAKSISYKVLE